MTVIRRFKMRRGTAAAWVTANTLLDAGEEGYETDTGFRKVGDGVTPWNSLHYNGVSAQTFTQPGTLQVASGSVGLSAPRLSKLSKVSAHVTTPPVGSSLILELANNGLAVATITIPSGSTDASGVISAATIDPSDVLTVNVTQVGSSSPGANLTLTVEFF